MAHDQGLDIDYFHCDRCNACMSVSLKKHKCVERSLESDCPICHSYMFTSTTPVMFLPCGHCMHVSCYEEYTLTNYICPLCSKALGDMELYFASIDELLEREQMPPEYQDVRALVYCSDCERKSTTNFHFVYHKVRSSLQSAGADCGFEDGWADWVLYVACVRCSASLTTVCRTTPSCCGSSRSRTRASRAPSPRSS